MIRRRFLARTLSAAALGATLSVSAASVARAEPEDPRREALRAGDGWGSAGTGTTGGADAAEGMVFLVTTKAEFVAALQRAAGAPAIITVRGDIDMNTGEQGEPLTWEDYADPAWDLEAYLEEYDPAHYEGDPEGPLEDARARSHQAQLDSVQVVVPSNVTLIGENGARLIGASLILRGENIIVRNLELTGMENWFPQRNRHGWVSEGFDVVGLIGATNVWLDHLTIDGPFPAGESKERIFGDVVHRVDGLLDITNGADMVTASWCVIRNGSTSVLIGNSDDSPEDEGKLRVTFHHNRFENLAERAPRVRYGAVHVYNNLIVVPDAEHYVYSWGVGAHSKLWIEDNAVSAVDGVTPAELVHAWGGTEVHLGVTRFNGSEVDALAAYNDVAETPLEDYPGPAPTLYGKRHPLPAVEPVVRSEAGARGL
ncbi:polysaccharide lyase family 1 protein [Brachybacterium sp. YJGR34]|uniref:pectate lyase family protein n=1 Tax=Brachybacterium sp. YJGR34 TaxID=2059911 RepID=UPI00130019AB|nr:polysaccharide lyase family 1 protein [Brachybacterium sp. YJGR34]